MFDFFNDLAINTYWARTEPRACAASDTSYRAQLDFPGDRYGVQLERLRVGEHFNPEVGFVRRPDIRRTLGEFRFSPRPRSMPSIRRFVWIGCGGLHRERRRPGGHAGAVGEFAIEFQNADRLGVTTPEQYEFIPRRSGLPRRDACRWAATTGRTCRLASIPAAAPRGCQPAFEYGTFYNGHRTASRRSRGRVARHAQFSVEPTYSINRVELVQGRSRRTWPVRASSSRCRRGCSRARSCNTTRATTP